MLESSVMRISVTSSWFETAKAAMDFTTWLVAWGTGVAMTIAVSAFRRASMERSLLLKLETARRNTERKCQDLIQRQRIHSRREALALDETLELEDTELGRREEEYRQQEEVLENESRGLKTLNHTLKMASNDLRANLQSAKESLRTTQHHTESLKSKRDHQLEHIATQNKEAILQRAIEESQSNYLNRLDSRRARSNEESERLSTNSAKRVLNITLNRFDSIGHLERVSNHFEMPTAAYDMLADPNAPLNRLLNETLDVELWERQPATIGIRGENPLGREAARRVLRRLSQDWTPSRDKILHLCNATNRQLEQEVRAAGRAAIQTLELERVHPEIEELVGRLKFRLSYSQNQLLHAIEVAKLSGLLADELGLDVKMALRGGLLHDIGKAMTHDHEGSHAVLGAEVARRCGEPEVVANAIGSHHNDEPMNSPIAHIVTAADALSGARPGARRETASLYLARMQQLSDIAQSHGNNVERVDIMHAGREIRLAVPGTERHHGEKMRASHFDDESMIELAENVAQSIEEEVVYPGQIRVTVIRESRVSSVAR